tara:strand:- start:79 stop:666 length:588 start_codon:yes stop_codon:yes gene_type:complete
MKRLLAYLYLVLVLTFSPQSWTNAETIKDFELEGISIGDSLLDYFSKDQIKKNFYSGSKKFVFSDHKSSKFKTYDEVQFNFKNNDRKFIIYELNGSIFFPNNVEACYKKRDEVLIDLGNLFPNAEKNFRDELFEHKSDKTGKSFYTYHSFNLIDGNIGVECTDWGKNMEKNGMIDAMYIFIETKEFGEFLINEAY